VTSDVKGDTSAPPVNHDHYKDHFDNTLCPFNAIGATLSKGKSGTANGLKEGIFMSGRYFVKIAGMNEPVEVKSLCLQESAPDTEDNPILLGTDVIFQLKVSIIPDLEYTDDFGGKRITLSLESLPKPVPAHHTVTAAVQDTLSTASDKLKAAGSAVASNLIASLTPSGYEWVSPFKT